YSEREFYAAWERREYGEWDDSEAATQVMRPSPLSPALVQPAAAVGPNALEWDEDEASTQTWSPQRQLEALRYAPERRASHRSGEHPALRYSEDSEDERAWPTPRGEVEVEVEPAYGEADWPTQTFSGYAPAAAETELHWSQPAAAEPTTETDDYGDDWPDHAAGADQNAWAASEADLTDP